MADHVFKIECPHCGVVLIVDRVTGEIIETRAALVADSTGDRFQDALQKVKNSAQAAEEKFQRSREAEKNKHQDLDALFKKSLEQVKKEGPIKRDIKNIDLD